MLFWTATILESSLIYSMQLIFDKSQVRIVFLQRNMNLKPAQSTIVFPTVLDGLRVRVKLKGTEIWLMIAFITWNLIYYPRLRVYVAHKRGSMYLK